MSAFQATEHNRGLDHVEAMVQRLKAAGGQIKTDIFSFSSSETPDAGMGVFATRDIAKDELLMEVPFSEVLSVEKVVSYPKLAHIFVEQPGVRDYPDEVLALGIMYAVTSQDEGCGWLDYVRACPDEVEMNTTIYWSDEELAELKGTMVFHLTQMMNRQIDSDWTAVHAALQQVYPELLGGATKQMYKWALSMVYSRAVGMHRKGKYERALVPVLDMANMLTSSDAGETFHYDAARDVMQLHSSREVPAGKECYSTVGQYCNAKLAYTYGYVLHKQENTAVDFFPAAVSDSAPYAALKKKLLQGQPLTAEQNYDFTGTLKTGWIAPQLLSTVRVMQGSAEELNALHMGHPFIYNMVSVANEVKTCNSLRELLLCKLGAAEKVEEERSRLGQLLAEGKPHSDRTVMALMIQVEEREVVASCIALLERCLLALQKLGEDYEPLDSKGAPSVTPSDGMD